MIQFSTGARNAMLDAFESTTGTAAVLRIYTGAPPANCAAAATGTQLVSMTLPSDWMSNASAGVKALLGTWQATAGAAGTAGYYRIWDSAVTTCHEQGTIAQTLSLTTSALTAANGNVLTFASTSGVANGLNVSGTGIPAGTTVSSFTGTTVVLSNTSTAGVANSTSITFTADMTLDNVSIASGQTVTISSKSLTAPNP
jgi:hypothetical protein